ncbi:MED14-domain-containing protein [Terfezia boudieri ATCC MYA-4762]|uniref:Mediator of RNA polymerase II transcription subunit 14 n=1 Tax=Terfezia boudieri ATCC MYA-4762 TaxID=1051890 RepID=A0A3N4M5M4_9PEZI|nr:MED14-domain-containing protein [Terfezia boudieri ATCC MYA-4762]
MSEHALSTNTVKASSEPVTNNANNNESAQDRAVLVGNGNGGGLGGRGENGESKLGKGRDENGGDDDEDEILDMSILAPALPKIKQGFYPLSMLIGRMVQDSKNQLDELIRRLQDAREMDRRQQLMAHVTERRQQFIKLLVLTTWARKADEVSQVIDVKAWFDSIEGHFQHAMWESFSMRRDLTNAKVPNPDLKTAVEVLTTGRAPSIPSYNYIPPTPLTPAETLKAYRNINTVLSIRLNLHEALPLHFREYRIQDGRATFSVKDEFEVDLSIGNEDPESQLYIIDFRLTFQPTLESLPPGRFRNEIEYRCNELLRAQGLTGLYEFLHDFVMTHKITTLKKQAERLKKGRWTDALHFHMHKRSLFIYYWTSRPEVRNWIEIGILRPRDKEPSRLGVRWHRDGKEVKDVTVPINTKNVSAEDLIKTVTALHAKYNLITIKDMLTPLPIFPPEALTLVTSDTDSFQSHLTVRITPTRLVKIQIEPITGRFALSKPNATIATAEHAMNHAKPEDWGVMVQQIVRARFAVLQHEIMDRARSLGWEIMKIFNMDPQSVKQQLGSSVRYLTYMRRKGWNKNCMVVVAFSDSGESWWVTEVQEMPKGYTLTHAERIPVSGNPDVTYQFLDNLELMACAIISYYSISRSLLAKGVQHSLREGSGHDPALRIPDLLIRFDNLIKHDWAVNFLKITFVGLSTNGNARITVMGRAKEPMTQLQSANLQDADPDVRFHPQTGSFALRFVVPVGDTIVDEIVERLHRIERLIRFVKVIRKYNLACHHVSLGRIAFSYEKKAGATAEISFSGDQNMQLHLPAGSPHIRIKHFLEQQLNDSGLEVVVMNLAVTAGILLALEEVEKDTPEGELFVLARSTQWFRMDYPKRSHVIDIQLRCKKGQFQWHVRDAAIQGGPGIVGAAGGKRIPAVALQELWSEPGIRGCVPLKTGLAATIGNVRHVILKIHSLIFPTSFLAQQQMTAQGLEHATSQLHESTATLVLPMGGIAPVAARQNLGG